MPKVKKVAKWRKSIKALRRVKNRKTRFTTKVIHSVDIAPTGDLIMKSHVKVFDSKVKKFIRGEWELSHALAVLGHLLENPAAAEKFGYDKTTKLKKK